MWKPEQHGTGQQCWVFLTASHTTVSKKREGKKKKSYGWDFFHPITHLSQSENPKPADPEWAEYCGTLFQVSPNNNNPSSSCVSILLLERFQRERKKKKRKKKKVQTTSCTHGESYARSHTLQCYHKTHRTGMEASRRKNTIRTAHTSLSRGYRPTESQ